MCVSCHALSTNGLSLIAAATITAEANTEGMLCDIFEVTDGVARAVDAYVSGYPPVTMEMARRFITNAAVPTMFTASMAH